VSASPASSGVAICQPWFYRRLAPKRGTIALLGSIKGDVKKKHFSHSPEKVFFWHPAPPCGGCDAG
jgi:hypothetical protein